MSARENAQVMLDIFSAIERRDPEGFQALCHPDAEFHWPHSLPYGGVAHGLMDGRPQWTETWMPLQPTEAERSMDARIVAATEDEVVVLWRQRGVTPTGNRFDGPVLGLYQVRDGQLARAEMFHFDTAALADFLTSAR